MAFITNGSGSGSSGGGQASKWHDLQTDVLTTIADRLNPKIDILRLRSVCRSWRSSLSPFNSAINFPLKLPCPFSYGGSTSLPYPTHLYLHHRTLYLLSPPQTLSNGSNSSNNSFLVRVEERENENSLNTVSLFNPIFSRPTVSHLPYSKHPKPKSPINLLDYGITLVCQSYVIHSGVGKLPVSIRKAVVSMNFFEKGDFVVLCLKHSGNLIFWRNGDKGWTEIEANGCNFDDIVSYNGKFYATADRKGRLVMIDSRLKPIDLVPKLMFGDGRYTHLVECDGNLYLLDRYYGNDIDEGVRFRVFKWNDKVRLWDYVHDLNDCVFFVGDDVNFSLSRKEYNGGIRNVIYCIEDRIDNIKVFDMKTNSTSSLVEFEEYVMLFWPPSSWFNQDAAPSF